MIQDDSVHFVQTFVNPFQVLWLTNTEKRKKRKKAINVI